MRYISSLYTVEGWPKRTFCIQQLTYFSNMQSRKKTHSINYVISFATWQTCRMHTVFFLLSITRQLSLWNIVRVSIAYTLLRPQLLRETALLCCSKNVKSSCYALARKSPAITMNLLQSDVLWITTRMPTEWLLFQICPKIKRVLLPAIRMVNPRLFPSYTPC